MHVHISLSQIAAAASVLAVPGPTTGSVNKWMRMGGRLLAVMGPTIFQPCSTLLTHFPKKIGAPRGLPIGASIEYVRIPPKLRRWLPLMRPDQPKLAISNCLSQQCWLKSSRRSSFHHLHVVDDRRFFRKLHVVDDRSFYRKLLD